VTIDYLYSDKLDPDNEFHQRKLENLENIQRAYARKAAILKIDPARLTLQTTEKCNLACIMCNIRRPNKNLLEMPYRTFEGIKKDILPTLVELHPTNIGEPLCSKWFGKLCRDLGHYGVLLDLTTNGTLLTKERILNILPILADMKISVDSTKKETFESIRKGAIFERVIKNIELAVKLRDHMRCPSAPTISIQMTLMRNNFRDLPEMIELAHRIGVDRVKAFHIFSYSKEMDGQIIINEEYEEVHRCALSLGKRLGISLEIAEPFNGFEKSTLIERVCPLLWVETFIDVNGDVYPCHSHGGDKAGSIIDSRFEEIWNSPFYVRLRKKLKRGKPTWHCAGCGMNFKKVDRNQAVPYDIKNFKCDRTYDTDRIRWSSRMKQFDIVRKARN